MSQLTAEYHVEILGGHTEVSAVVNQTLVSVTGIGRIAKDKLVTTKGLKPGQDLVVTKWVGLEGTSIIATEFEKELKKRLPVSIVDESKKFASLLSVVKDSRVAMQVGVSAMHDVTEGGMFGALWEMAEASGVGLCVDVYKRQTQDYDYIDPHYGVIVKDGGDVLAADDRENAHATKSVSYTHLD